MGINIYENKPFRVYNADYFSNNITSSIGLYFITDKQSLFMSSIRTIDNGIRNENFGHRDFIRKIDGIIYDDNEMDPDFNLRTYNTYIYLFKDYESRYMHYLISLPENEYISLSEYMLLNKALDELEEYNKHVCLPEEKCKHISILIGDIEEDDKNVDEARSILRKFTIGYPELHKETTDDYVLRKNGISGETLSEDEIIVVIKNYVDFSKCNSFNNLLRLMELCDRYYNDSYYCDFFLKVFPNYLEVAKLVNEIIGLNISDFELDNLTFDNIYDTLNSIYSNYRAIFCNIKGKNR